MGNILKDSVGSIDYAFSVCTSAPTEVRQAVIVICDALTMDYFGEIYSDNKKIY